MKVAHLLESLDPDDLWYQAWHKFNSEHDAGVRQMGGEDDAPIAKMNKETLFDYMCSMVEDEDFKKVYGVSMNDKGPVMKKAEADAMAFIKRQHA
jgi:hypothetical protein